MELPSEGLSVDVVMAHSEVVEMDIGVEEAIEIGKMRVKHYPKSAVMKRSSNLLRLR
jgi:hypothetical protein